MEEIQGLTETAGREDRRALNEGRLRRLKEGDESALDELVTDNLGLVRRLAQHFCGRGTEYDDLVQIGVIGMIKACRSFDLSLGTAFSTYAVPLIIGEIRRHLRDDGLIKVSRTLRRRGVQIMRFRESFIGGEGREPRISEIASACDMTPEEVAEAMEACCDVASLSEPAGDEEGGALDTVIAGDDGEVDNSIDRIALGEALGSLAPDQRRIIMLRYFGGLSQQQTGERLGLSQVKISREEKKIISLLRGMII